MASSLKLNSLCPILFSRFRSPRRTTLAVFLGVVSLSLILLYSTSLGIDAALSEWLPSSFIPTVFTSGTSRQRSSTCSPREYAQGRWIEQPYYTRPGPLSRGWKPSSAVAGSGDSGGMGQVDSSPPSFLTNLTRKEDIFTLTRFQGCASSRDYWWHFAVDQEERWDRFPRALNWEWVPGGRCNDNLENGGGLREWDSVQVLQYLLDHGGWLLIGDSITENHFFSLSCLLYPHVIATPRPHDRFDRGWPQHMYLNPASPLLHDDSSGEEPTLRLPLGFDIAQTPIATFRRVDLLWSQEELETMHREIHPEFYRSVDSIFKLFSKEPVWTISPDEYLDILTQPLPLGRYGTLIVSTAGHWTTNLFAGYKEAPAASSADQYLDDLEDAGVKPVFGYDGLLQFFGEVMEKWASKVQAHLDSVNVNAKKESERYYPPGKSRPGIESPVKRQVIVRAYLPGHDGCHHHRSAVDELQPIPPSWNWAKIPTYNQIFENILNESIPETPHYPDVHFLPIDLPGRFRPDGHVRSDCLHIMTGVGVLEGWSHYIWHYLTREI